LAVVNLHKVRERKAERVIPVSYSTIVVDGEKYREPFFDLDELGDPQDYGFDDEPRDPTAEEFAGANFCYNVSPSEFTETAVMIADKGDTHNFDFSERPYLRRISTTTSALSSSPPLPSRPRSSRTTASKIRSTCRPWSGRTPTLS
jgi:hypothetical protein